MKIQKELLDIIHKARPLFVMALLGAFVCCMSGCGGGTIKKSITNAYDGSTATTAGGGGATAATIPVRAFKWVRPRATTTTMNALLFAGNTLYAVGRYGTIVKTTATGSEFSVQMLDFTGMVEAPESANLIDIDCVSESTCIAVGDRGSMARTRDGGATWQFIGSGIDDYLLAIDCLSDGSTCIAAGKKGAYLKTTDGGDTWVRNTIEGADKFNDIQCHEKSGTCYLSEFWKVHTSTDKGQTWTTAYEADVTLFKDIECPKNANYCLVIADSGMSKLYTATNQGATWEQLEPPSQFGANSRIQCNDDGTMCISGGNAGNVLKSTDHGQTWTLAKHDSMYSFDNIACTADMQTCYATAFDGVWIKSTDQGATWDTVSSSVDYSIKSVDCPNGGLTCYVTGGSLDGIVLKTTDGGSSWISTGPENCDALNSIICPVDANTCYILGEDPSYPTLLEIQRTTDGGVSWENKSGAATDDIFGMGNLSRAACVSNDVCIYAGYKGIYKSTNAGDDWTRLYENDSTYMYDIACNSAATQCVAVGKDGLVVTTTDSGATWTVRTSGVTANLTAVMCQESMSICFATGGAGNVLKSTNGGATWTNQNTGVTLSLSRVVCPRSADTCYAVSDYGALYQTTNGGQAWTPIFTGVMSRYETIHCTDTTCYMAGENGMILSFEL